MILPKNHTGGKFITDTTVIICGAAGTGKSYLANAIGSKACRQGFDVACHTMQKLMYALRISRIQGKDQKLMDKPYRLDELIIDDFGMKPLGGRQGVRLSRPRRIVHGRLPLAALSGASAAVRWRTPFRLPPLPPDFKPISDDRCNRKSLIIASQLPVTDRHALFGNELIAGACMDRIVHKTALGPSNL